MRSKFYILVVIRIFRRYYVGLNKVKGSLNFLWLKIVLIFFICSVWMRIFKNGLKKLGIVGFLYLLVYGFK